MDKKFVDKVNYMIAVISDFAVMPHSAMRSRIAT